VNPRIKVAATAIQNHWATPNSAKLPAKISAAMTTKTPLLLMSPIMSSAIEPTIAPREGAP
jgi:hypothetical protein